MLHQPSQQELWGDKFQNFDKPKSQLMSPPRIRNSPNSTWIPNTLNLAKLWRLKQTKQVRPILHSNSSKKILQCDERNFQQTQTIPRVKYLDRNIAENQQENFHTTTRTNFRQLIELANRIPKQLSPAANVQNSKSKYNSKLTLVTRFVLNYRLCERRKFLALQRWIFDARRT